MRVAVASLLLLVLTVGCSTKRTYTFTAQPDDAMLRLDGAELGRGPVTREIEFKDKRERHTASASRLGFQDQTVELTRETESGDIRFDLKPVTKRVAFRIEPVPAKLFIDGEPISANLVTGGTQELEFAVDAKDNWIHHTVRAERDGWEPIERTIKWTDQSNLYELTLEPKRKNLVITSDPPGATVRFGGEEVGVTPVTLENHPFPVDVQTGEFLPQRLVLTKPGYDPVETSISWDGGGTQYMIEMPPKTKTVQITTDPPGATVTIDGQTLEQDSNGVSAATLPFIPVDEQGTLRTYEATVTHQTANSEWYPETLSIGWDEGQQSYQVSLREILTRPVPMLEAVMKRDREGWHVTPTWTTTVAMKDVTEGANRNPPVQLTRLDPGTMLDSVSVSPDGSLLVYTVLTAPDGGDFTSQILVMRTDGSGGAQMFTDGRSLDIAPSFTAGGDQIVFSSNRGGRDLSVWSMSATGAPGITQLTTGDTNDLWPTIDSDPRPRLYYEAYVDTRPDSRLYMSQLGTTIRTDLTHIGGSQPRVSPRADAVVFTAVNQKTGNRDIYRMGDRGGEPVNLTNTPDIDEFDPTWSRDGSRIAFAADRGSDLETGRNYDIWMMDLSQSGQPVQITTNGSWDDSPAFDPAGGAIYFRSNRGGQWNIWRVPTP